MNLKRYFTISFILGVYVTNSYSAGNPAAIYCERMGYEYVIETNSEGKSVGMCKLPDGSKVNAWDFFKGKVKPEYSYCKKAGYDIVSEEEIQGSYTTQTAYCVKGTTLRSGDSESKVAMVDLMEKEGFNLFNYSKLTDTVVKPYNPGLVYAPGRPTSEFPETFDAREEGYMNEPRNQGALGSCWAFAAAGVLESEFNKLFNFRGEKRISLSESFIVYCLGGNPNLTTPIYEANCIDNDSIKDGGNPCKAMNEISENGVCKLKDFEYRITPPEECTHWNDPKIYTPSGRSQYVFDIDDLKSAIYNQGSVCICIHTQKNFHNYVSGIYDLRTDHSDTTGSHAVCLVGWGVENNTEYWILRNSWGTESWGENGYMKLKMNDNPNKDIDEMVYPSVYENFTWEENQIEINHPISNYRGNTLTLKGKKILLRDGFKAEANSGFRAIPNEPAIKENTPVVIPCAENNLQTWKGLAESYTGGSNQIVTELFDLTINSNITLYPNPSSTGQFTVEFGDAVGEKWLRIYAMSGELVYESNFVGEKAEIALNGATAGIYVVQVVTADDAMTQQLIIK